jgi:hypothetical protein
MPRHARVSVLRMRVHFHRASRPKIPACAYVFPADIDIRRATAPRIFL